MSPLSSRIWNDENWKRKRWISTIICIFYHFLFGLEYQSINIVLLYYLKDYFDPKYANLRYSLIMAAMFLPGYFSGVIGKFNDRRKNLKSLMVLILCLTCSGNLMFSLYYSIWFIFIGRFLSGFGIPLRSIIAGM